MQQRQRRRRGQPVQGRLAENAWDPKRNFFDSELAQEQARLKLGELLERVIAVEVGEVEDAAHVPLPMRFYSREIGRRMDVRVPAWMAVELVRDVVQPVGDRVLKSELLDPDVRPRLADWLDTQRTKVVRLRGRAMLFR